MPRARNNPTMRRFNDLGEAKRHAKRYAKRTDQPHYVYCLSSNPKYAVLPGDHPVQRSYEHGALTLGNTRLVHTARPPAPNPPRHGSGQKRNQPKKAQADAKAIMRRAMRGT